ncbi:MAG: hypothetical protein JNK88_10985 [Mangrovicoccus sp.]|nr:hypothetical protein [Mangrovicoccus sp.]
MTTTETDPKPLSALSETERAAVLARLDTLRAEIAAVAAEKAASPRQEDQRWAALLSAIQTVPDSRRLDDILYAAEGQPVLVQWATRDENATVASAILEDKIATARAERPLPPVGVARSGPVLTGPAPAGGGWGWLPALLLWLLFLALLAAIYWLLLLGCALGPPFGPAIGRCTPLAAASPAQAAEDRRAGLQDELAFLQQQLGQAPQCPVETTLTDPPPPPVVPIPRPTPPPVQETEAPPEPDPATDFDRAREQAGGRTGDVTVTLLWNGHTDLDLSVRCPDGQVLKARNLMPEGQPAACGGEIDVDANLCARYDGAPGHHRACLEWGSPPQMNPVENAFFLNAQAIKGTYAVMVSHFAADGRDPAATIPFAVQVRQGDGTEVARGAVGPGDTTSVVEFTIE